MYTTDLDGHNPEEVSGMVTGRIPDKKAKRLIEIRFVTTLAKARRMANREEIFFAVWNNGTNRICL